MGTFQSDHSVKSCKDFYTKVCTLDSVIIRIQQNYISKLQVLHKNETKNDAYSNKWGT